MAGSLNVVGRAHEAGPSAGFTWFVYGSSLDAEAFAAWARDHGYRLPDFAAASPARLRGWRLAFDAPSKMWGGPVASLAESAGDEVEGLAVPMPGDARGLVDHKEGAVSGLYRVAEGNGSQIFVSRGTGYWGPPMRLGSPPEIAHIVLT